MKGVKLLVKHQRKVISKACTREVHKLSTPQSPFLRLDLVSGCVQQRCKLSFGDAPQLVEVETLAVTDITGVVVHWVSDRTGTFEELSSWETILVEWLMI